MYRSLEQNSDSSDENNNCLIEDISIPYLERLPSKLCVGSYIEIFAKTEENTDRFSVNLVTDSNDFALHFNPRLEEAVVVRNSRIDDEWANEEREPLKMPFEKNKSFTLILSVDKEVYRLYINGIHFADFRHRIPYTDVTSIGIEGDLQVLWIRFDRKQSEYSWDAFSEALSSIPIQQQSYEIESFYEPKVPFVQQIKGGIRDGMVLSIIGRPLSKDQKFDINFIQDKGSDKDSNPNITFHMSIRFGQSLVVRNYRFEGEWGEEDRYANEFPFNTEKIFDLRIIVEKNRFIVIINGKNFTEYPIRLFPLSETNRIEINGNLKLLSVGF